MELLLRFSYLVVFCALFFVSAILRPMNNWDMIPYTAAAYEREGLSGEELRAATYRDVEEYVPEAKFASMVQRGYYRQTVYSDQTAFEQQLPFYNIRYLYISLVHFLGVFLGSFSFATVVVSAFFGSLLIFVSGLMHFSLPSKVAYFLTPPLVSAAGAFSLARFSTPDAFAAFGGALMFFLFLRKRIFAAAVIIALLPLFRTDFLILSAFASIYLFFSSKRLAAFSAIGAALLYFWVGAYAGNYGHATIFNFTLVYGPQPYPADMEISQNIGDYIRVYVRGVLAFVTGKEFLFAIAIFVLWSTMLHKRDGVEPFGQFFFLTLAFVLTHFALFPAAFSRTYFLLIWSGLMLLIHAYRPVRLSLPH